MIDPEPYEKDSRSVPAEGERPNPLKALVIIIALVVGFGCLAGYVFLRTDTFSHDRQDARSDAGPPAER